MEPITIGLLAAGAYLLLRKPKTSASSYTSTGIEPAPPDQQAALWAKATSQKWTQQQLITGEPGKNAQVYTSNLIGSSLDRTQNDIAFRNAMGAGLRLGVSPSVGTGGGTFYLVIYSDGFPSSKLPGSVGPLVQLFAPPPAAYGGGELPGPSPIPSPYPSGGGATGSPFSEISDPVLRSKIEQVYASQEIGLLDLKTLADDLESAGYPQSAAALRERGKILEAQRRVEATQRGGWLYVVPGNAKTGIASQTPFSVAQYYGGVRPGVTQELLQANEQSTASDSWWYVGAEVLLPAPWKDPSLKPPPAPLSVSKPAGPAPTTPGGTTPTAPQKPPGVPGVYLPSDIPAGPGGILGGPTAPQQPGVAPPPFPGAAPPGVVPDWNNAVIDYSQIPGFDQLPEIQVQGNPWEAAGFPSIGIGK